MKKQRPETKQMKQVEPRLQAAALPFRREKELEILLVSSLDTGRWIVPKGWPMKGRTNSETAKREAFEEAGVKGEIAKKPAGLFHYDKRRRNGGVWRCMVEVFPLEVKTQCPTWPEKKARKTSWRPWSEAADLVDDAELGDIIRAFAAANAGEKTAA